MTGRKSEGGACLPPAPKLFAKSKAFITDGGIKLYNGGAIDSTAPNRRHRPLSRGCFFRQNEIDGFDDTRFPRLVGAGNDSDALVVEVDVAFCNPAIILQGNGMESHYWWSPSAVSR